MNHRDILERLTLEEKVALLSGRDIWSTYPIERVGLPAMYLSDGPHGVRRQLGEGDHLGLNDSQPATCFPTAAGLANSWDPELAREIGKAIGEEAVSQGINVLLGPGLNTKRNPLGGRNFEYYSEDPLLSGRMAAAFIQGVQANGIAACPKHFAANSQEHLRMTNDSVVDIRTLRELYLTGFEIAVREGRPKAIMTSYNRINGIYANEDPALLTQILRKEWGFGGFVVTDWGGSNDHVEGTRAGSNLEMPGTGGDSDGELLEALRTGRIDEETVDQRVDELLDVILSTTQATAGAPVEFDRQAHHELARKAAAASAVLLKNEGQLLPLAPGSRVAVIGDLAQMPRYQGAGSSLVNPTKLDLPLDCLRENGLTITGYAQGYRRDGVQDPALLKEAAALAERGDTVLLYLGLPEIMESEGMDRSHMRLPENQNELLGALAQVSHRIVVVLAGGAPVELPWLDQCQCLIHGYLGGQAGAGAMADLLVGKATPSGRLAETYPVRYEDVPSARYFPGRERTSEYREGLYVGYRYYATVGKPVRFPFGFGLSYTTFAYSDLRVTSDEVRFCVTNTGDRPGTETAQLYVSWPDSQVFRPARELKGFCRVTLSPGETAEAVIPLDDLTFRYFDPSTGRWERQGGVCRILVGANVETLPLSADLVVEGSGAPVPWEREKLACYYTGAVTQVDDGTFAALLGYPIPPSKWDRSRPLDYNDSMSQMVYARSLLARSAWRILDHQRRKSEDRGKPDLNLLFISNMPFRGLAKMMGGMVSTSMAQAVLHMANGHVLVGAGRLLRAWWENRKRMAGRRKRL